MAVQKQERREHATERVARWLRLVSSIAGALVGLFFLVLFLSFFGSLAGQAPVITGGNVAVIPVQGVILTTDGPEQLFGGETIASSSRITQFIKDANGNPDVQAIVLEIDSPGGSPVASDEIAAAVAKANKTTVAVIREVGASGAYWVATAADRIFAHPLSVTGSIGVTGSYLEFAGLLRDWNITYRSLTSGKYKDAGSPYKELTRDEEALYRDLLDRIHGRFVRTVAENRGLPEARVGELATGFVYLGEEARELGLIDEFGGRPEALAWLERELNITAKPFELQVRPTPFELLFGALGRPFYAVGRGIGSAFMDRARADAMVRPGV
jgi:protease-4